MKKNNIGSLLAYLRKSKGLSINQLIGDTLSHSQYHRIVNNQSDITLRKFLKILLNLNVPIEEFFYLLNFNVLDITSTIFTLKQMFNAKDTANLQKISQSLYSQYIRTDIIKYHHLGIIAKVYLAQISDKKSKSKEKSQQTIQHYLFNADYWGYYELLLFNHTFEFFDSQTIQILAKHAINAASRYANYSPYKNEYIRLLSKLISYFINQSNRSYAFNLIEQLERINLHPNDLNERLLIIFWINIKTYYYSKDLAAYKILSDTLNYLSLIGDTIWLPSFARAFTVITSTPP